MCIQGTRSYGWHTFITRTWAILAAALLSWVSTPHARADTPPKEISFTELLAQQTVTVPSEGARFTVPSGYQLRESSTGLTVTEYSKLVTFLADAKPIGPTTAVSGNSITMDLRSGGRLEIAADGVIRGMLPELTYWVTLFRVSPASTPTLVGLIGRKPEISAVSVGSSSTVTVSSATQSLSFNVTQLSSGASVSSGASATPVQITFINQRAAAQSPGPGGVVSSTGGAPLASSARKSEASSSGASSTLTMNSPIGMGNNPSAASGGSSGPGGGAVGGGPAGSFPGGAPTGGGTPGGGGGGVGPGTPPGDGGGGDNGAPGCTAEARIVMGPPSSASISPADPTNASADSQNIPFLGGVIRAALGTASVVIGSLRVGAVTTLAATSDSPETILQGAAYADASAVGLHSSSGSNTSSGQGSSFGASSRSDVLYLGGIGYSQDAKGLHGFGWERTTLAGGQEAVLIKTPGSINNALLTFGTPNKVGYAHIREIQFAQGARLTYDITGWEGTITYTHPKNGTLITRFSKQPASDPNQNFLEVVKTLQIGDTIFELAKYTFSDFGGKTFYPTSQTDLRSGATYDYTYNGPELPVQWTTASHTKDDPKYGKTVRALSGVSGDAAIAFKSGPTDLIQIPGDTPSFRAKVSEILVGSRQYLMDGGTLEEQIKEKSGEPSDELWTSSFDVTNPTSRFALYEPNWQQNKHNHPAVSIDGGVRTEYKRNSVGAIEELKQIFANGGSWTSTFKREGYWIREAIYPDGTKVALDGELPWPTKVSVTTALGTYTATYDWKSYEKDGLVQKLLSRVQETAPNGVTSTATLTWNDDNLKSITDNSGQTTEFSPTSRTLKAGNGQLMLAEKLSSTFTTFNYAHPSQHTLFANLAGGILTQRESLLGATISEATSTFGAAATGEGANSLRAVTGASRNAANHKSSTSSKQDPKSFKATQTGSGGTAETTQTQGSESRTGSCGQCTANGVVVCPEACAQSFMTGAAADTSHPARGVGINTAHIRSRDGKYYVFFEWSNTVLGSKATVLLTKGSGIGEVKEFAFDPPRECMKELNLDYFKSAQSLRNCTVETTNGALDKNGDIIPPFPPQPKECEIDKEDACFGFEMILAAGIVNPDTASREQSDSVMLNGPAFQENGTTSGFSGHYSNRYYVRGDPSACS